MTLTVYGMGLSPFVRKVRVALMEKKLAYEHDPVSPFGAPDWFYEISPLRKIPAFRDSEAGDDKHNTLPDSSVICAYLEKKYPSPALYPAAPYDYARALWLEEFADSQLTVLCGAGIFRPVMVAQLMGQQPDFDRARKTITEEMPPALDYLEKQLAGKDYFVGGQFSIADLSVATVLRNACYAGWSIDKGKWPKLAQFADRIWSRPSFVECTKGDEDMLSKLKKLEG